VVFNLCSPAAISLTLLRLSPTACSEAPAGACEGGPRGEGGGTGGGEVGRVGKADAHKIADVNTAGAVGCHFFAEGTVLGFFAEPSWSGHFM
jgi:hypothetical protein